jgi:predicted CXXCH cytochrome family protein
MGPSGMRSHRPPVTGKRGLVILAVLGALGGGALWSGLGRPGPDGKSTVRLIPSGSSSSPFKNTAESVAYIGDEACAACHAEIAKTFRHHPMGRSMTTPAAILPGTRGVVFEVGDLAYSIDRRDGRVYHAETRGAGAGAAPGKTEAEVRYIIGSGTRGYSFLIEREGELFQSPIAWYTQERKWDLAPGYRDRNQHFDRKITAGCLFCHTNRFEKVEGKSTVFHGLSIGCERCHGPGELHAQGPQPVDGVDVTIVNPVRLRPAALRENVCEQCHHQGTDRLETSENSLSAYRPGLPLEKYVLIPSTRFDPSMRNNAVSHTEQMRNSRCFRESSGELGCTSCHDPHVLPEPEDRVAYYRKRCFECHADRGCSLPVSERLARSPDDDCMSCHMPRSRTTNVAHTALTNHTIPRDLPAAR